MTLATLEHAIFQHLAHFGRYPSALMLGRADAAEITCELHRSGLEEWSNVTVESLGGMSIMGLRVNIQSGFEGYRISD